jgi:hypothetical protein
MTKGITLLIGLALYLLPLSAQAQNVEAPLLIRVRAPRNQSIEIDRGLDLMTVLGFTNLS